MSSIFTSKLLIEILSSGGKFLVNSLQLSEQLSNVYSSMSQIYYDFRDSKLDAASNALQQAYNADSRIEKIEEVNKAISFLELAYWESKTALDRKRIIKEHYLLFFESTTEVDVIPKSQRKDWLLKMVDISSSIYLLYKYKGSSLVDKWRDTAIDLFSSVVYIYHQITTEELQRVNPDFVNIKTTTEIERVEYSDILVKYEDVEKYTLTPTNLGYNYIEMQQKAQIDKFIRKLERTHFLP